MKQTWEKISRLPDREMLKAPSPDRDTSVLKMERLGVQMSEMVFVLDGKNVHGGGDDIREDGTPRNIRKLMEPGCHELWPTDPQKLKQKYLEIWTQERALRLRENRIMDADDYVTPNWERECGIREAEANVMYPSDYVAPSFEDFCRSNEARANLIDDHTSENALTQDEEDSDDGLSLNEGHEDEGKTDLSDGKSNIDDEVPAIDKRMYPEHFERVSELRAAEQSLREQGNEPPKTIDGWFRLCDI